MAGICNFVTRTNENFTRTVTWKSAGVAVDLTSYSASMGIRQRGQTTNALSITSTAGQITLGGTAGTITPVVTVAQIAASLSVGVWDYDIKVTDGSSAPKIILAGTLTVKEGYAP